MNEVEKPNCTRCEFFHVTWDPAAPRGCRAHGFKSPGYPSQVVQQASGMACQLYRLKAVAQPSPPPPPPRR